MSKNVAIKEGGVSRNFGNTRKLTTNLQGGGVCYWVPESETQSISLYASENRTYRAEEESTYGFSSVRASVLNAVDGALCLTDTTGASYIIVKDETNHLFFMTLPDNLHVSTLPTKTEYKPGETIDYTGMVVVARRKEHVWPGSDYNNGVVPINELYLPVFKAGDVGTQVIPIYLSRPYDGVVIEGSFAITVTEEEEEPENE